MALFCTGEEIVEAVKSGDARSVRALIARGFDVNAPDVDGTTALHWAVRSDDASMVQLLLRAGATTAHANRYQVTPLSLAAVKSKLRFQKWPSRA